MQYKIQLKISLKKFYQHQGTKFGIQDFVIKLIDLF